MAHWKTMMDEDYKYLGSYSFEEVTGEKEITLTFEKFNTEEVTATGGIKSKRIVAYFAEKGTFDKVEIKPMILNATNCKIIQAIYGTGDVDKWVGKKVTIYVTTTSTRQGTVDCLRIKRQIPEEKIFTCFECGKVIDEKTYRASTQKYGVALCSKECLEKYNQTKKEKEEEGKNDA